MKEQCRNVVLQYLVDGQDGFYLYHPEVTESVISHGEAVGAISNYETDGWQFNLSYALLQTLYVLDADSLTNRKYLVLVTDRLTDVKPLVELLRTNERDDIRCEVYVILIGDRCRFTLVDDLCPLHYTRINDPSDILFSFEVFDAASDTSLH